MKRFITALCLSFALLVGSVGVSWGADFLKGYVAYQKGDYATALREWTPLAETGNITAQKFLGDMYRQGKGVPKDDNKAVAWWTRAAKQGNARAQSNLGVMYQLGLGVSQNYEEAAKWYELASSQGNLIAKNQLGVVFVLLGKKLRKNNVTCTNINACREALEFYYKAAALGNGDAMILIPNVLLFLNKKITSEIDKLKHKEKMAMWWMLGLKVGNTSPELKKNTKAILNDIKKDVTLYEAGETLARECIRKKYKGC